EFGFRVRGAMVMAKIARRCGVGFADIVGKGLPTYDGAFGPSRRVAPPVTVGRQPFAGDVGMAAVRRRVRFSHWWCNGARENCTPSRGGGSRTSSARGCRPTMAF